MTGIPFERVFRNLDSDSVGQGSPAGITNERLTEQSVSPYKVYRLKDSGEFGSEGEFVIGISGEWLNMTSDVTVDWGEQHTIEVDELVVTGNLTVEGQTD